MAGLVPKAWLSTGLWAPPAARTIFSLQKGPGDQMKRQDLDPAFDTPGIDDAPNFYRVFWPDDTVFQDQRSRLSAIGHIRQQRPESWLDAADGSRCRTLARRCSPVLNAVQRQTQNFSLTGSHGVVETHALPERPSRRLRESAATMLKNGRFLEPPRESRITTMMCDSMMGGRRSWGTSRTDHLVDSTSTKALRSVSTGLVWRYALREKTSSCQNPRYSACLTSVLCD